MTVVCIVYLGMDALSLHSFLTKVPCLVELAFPTEKDRKINKEEVKACLQFDGKEANVDNERTAAFFEHYIDELNGRKEDGVGLSDLLCFWTAVGTLVTKDGPLKVTFDDGALVLPLSETCFRKIILPTKHETYELFKAKMDIALKYGSKGFSFS
ncbi:PREDICTED: uncharacterized protein LOC107346752 [Acropora digitifera]|uniref:uncharacterized protein LOC107346752 n=1 Tax=Acropora digitifera TaxID=70779 RepID=UPI00077A6993|nr:PREDICTED: uncharacterized protein LOC107346752 [Acropora digitifera]